MSLFDGIHNWKTNLSENEIEQLKKEIDNIIDYHIERPTLFVLDKYAKKRCLIEYVVEKLAKFHLEHINENYDDYELEFWFKNTSDFNCVHCDKDEVAYKQTSKNIHPQLASILYLDDNENPTYISEIKEKDSIFKTFENKSKCCLSFPKKGCQTTFDGSYFHGSISKNHENKDKRYILLINFWKHYRPKDLIYFDIKLFPHLEACDENSKTYQLIKQKPINYTTNKQIVFDYVFYESLIYTIPTIIVNKHNRFRHLIEYVEEKIRKRTLIFLEYSKNYKPYDTINQNINENIKNSQQFLLENIQDYYNREETNIDVHRFQQRYVESNFVSREQCKYVIDCAEKYATENNGWTTNRHGSYPTTDLPVKCITQLKELTNSLSEKIIAKIKKFYQLTEINIDFFIDDIFIVKYEFDALRDIQRGLDLHADGSLLSFQILLNDNSEFQGGGTFFSDGLIHYPNCGDLCFHYSRIKHAGIPITKGKRYLLVGFLGYKIL